MKIYTKGGDDGTTALLGGSRVPKYDHRIEAYGTVDELNSYLGLLAVEASEFGSLIQVIQDRLFVIGSSLATDEPGSKVYHPDLKLEDVLVLEQSIDRLQEELPELKSFILPGGLNANALAHIARCVCRRAERLTVYLANEVPVDPLVLAYLNRLSDWLFVLARVLSHRAGVAEIKWEPRKR